MASGRDASLGAPERVLVGRIGAAHGVRGEVRLVSFTGDPKAIAAHGPLSDARGTRRFEIAALRPLKGDMLVARFIGVATRDAAEALNNVELYLPRAVLPATGEDEFYHADLIGLAAFDAAGPEIGHVLNVLNFGGGDILEIAPRDGAESLLLPFTRACVPHVDLAQKRLIVVPPAEIEVHPDEDAEESTA